jgi:hypothetical protein
VPAGGKEAGEVCPGREAADGNLVASNVLCCGIIADKTHGAGRVLQERGETTAPTRFGRVAQDEGVIAAGKETQGNRVGFAVRTAQVAPTRADKNGRFGLPAAVFGGIIQKKCVKAHCRPVFCEYVSFHLHLCAPWVCRNL